MKNSLKGNVVKHKMSNGRIAEGVNKHAKGEIAFWMAYIEFLTTMTEDPRFVWLYGDMEA